jgi:hypothetical protein
MSYQSIQLDANITLSWDFPQLPNTTVIQDFNDVQSDDDARTITLPSAIGRPMGVGYIFANVGFNDFIILTNDGIPIQNAISPGQIFEIFLIDNVTNSGLWRTIAYGGGVVGISALSTESKNTSLTVTPGSITPPAGNLVFEISKSLDNLNSLSNTISKGFLIIKDTNPLQYSTASLQNNDLNIIIENADGVLASPVINLAQDINNISSIKIANSSIANNSIVVDSTNDFSIITTNANVQINEVIFAPNEVSGITLLIADNVKAKNTAKASVVFFDNNLETNNIIIENSFNVASVSGAQGVYTVTFTESFLDALYGVNITLSRSSTVANPIIATYRNRTTTSVIIQTSDLAGNFYPALDGISIEIFKS